MKLFLPGKMCSDKSKCIRLPETDSNIFTIDLLLMQHPEYNKINFCS